MAAPVAGPVPPHWGIAAATETVSVVSVAQDANDEFRPYMEDGHKVIDPLLSSGRGKTEERWGYFAVYDGHGGRQEVDYCEGKLHEVLLSELRALQAPIGGASDVRGALAAAFQKIDGQLAMMGAWQSGCTCTIALTHRQGSTLTLHVANVGDSRAVLLGPHRARRLSVDHRASDPTEARRVAQEGGMVRHGRVGGQLSVSRSLGDHHLKSSGVSCVPDVCGVDVNVTEDHALVVASDGLWDALEDGEAREVLSSYVDRAVAQGGDSKTIADRLRQGAARVLVEQAKERGSRDNILALVIFF